MARGRRGSIGKAARNEQRKLVATASNNVGVAFALAGLLQPALAYVQQGRPVDLAAMRATAIFLFTALIFALVARRVAARLEA